MLKPGLTNQAIELHKFLINKNELIRTIALQFDLLFNVDEL